MNALDTNVLVRFLVNDDPRQGRAVKALFETAERQRTQFHVPLLVVLELLWVLSAVYRVQRQQILGALDQLLGMPILSFEKDEVLRRFVEVGRKNTLDLADLLIGLSAQAEGAGKVRTFDAKAARASEWFEPF